MMKHGVLEEQRRVEIERDFTFLPQQQSIHCNQYL
jgi:hypothetical protein